MWPVGRGQTPQVSDHSLARLGHSSPLATARGKHIIGQQGQWPERLDRALQHGEALFTPASPGYRRFNRRGPSANDQLAAWQLFGRTGKPAARHARVGIASKFPLSPLRSSCISTRPPPKAILTVGSIARRRQGSCRHAGGGGAGSKSLNDNTSTLLICTSNRTESKSSRAGKWL